jgi:hypothetical protein
MILLWACSTAGPLLAGKYDDGQVKFLSRISTTDIGQKLINHYSKQIGFFSALKVGPYEDLESSEQEKLSFVFAGLIFAGSSALFVSFISLVLFVINGVREPQQAISKRAFVLILLLIILNGTIIRLILASVVFGNYDVQSYQIVADIAAGGGNVYAETGRYNYSPLWFMTLAALNRIQLQLPALSFHFVVKSFLCGVDLLTLAFLLLIAADKKISLIKTAILFYLNPLSFLITGYHGQFENLAIFMVVLGLFAYLKLKSKPILGTALLWIFATFGMFVKHNIFYELIICLNSAIKRYWVKLLLFAVSVCIFLVMFLSYWGCESKGIIKNPDGSTFESSSEGIILNVFRYSSTVGIYGITSLFYFPPLKYVFIVGMFIFPLFLKSRDIVRQCLLGMLFFLAFTSGVSIQYFILPIALGALCQSKGFLFYTLVGSLFVLGDVNNVFVPGFHLFRWNIVWIGAICWFAAELYNIKKEQGELLCSKIKKSSL